MEDALNSTRTEVEARLLAAVKRAEQYIVLAVHDSEGALRRIAEGDLGMVRAAIVLAENDPANALFHALTGEYK